MSLKERVRKLELALNPDAPVLQVCVDGSFIPMQTAASKRLEHFEKQLKRIENENQKWFGDHNKRIDKLEQAQKKKPEPIPEEKPARGKPKVGEIYMTCHLYKIVITKIDGDRYHGLYLQQGGSRAPSRSFIYEMHQLGRLVYID
jgi:hypothetical protein